MSPQTIMILYVLIRIYVYNTAYIYMRTCTVCTRTDINMVTVLPIEITSGLQLQPLLLCLERKRRRHPNQPTFEHFTSISYISYTCMSYIYILYCIYSDGTCPRRLLYHLFEAPVLGPWAHLGFEKKRPQSLNKRPTKA